METIVPPLDNLDDKHKKILGAAKELFLECGYAATSMDQVAHHARVSKTTLYTRFPSKEALFAAAVESECRAYGMRFSPADFVGLSVDEALRQIGQRFLNLVYSPVAVRVEQLVNGEAARFPEIASTLWHAGPEQTRTMLARYFADAMARGLLDVPDVDFAAGQFLMALKGCAHSALAANVLPRPTAEELATHLTKAVALFLDGARKRS